MTDGIKYEEMNMKVSKPVLRREIKAHKELNINSMGSWAIVLFLAGRHRLGLLVTTNILTLGVLVVRW